VVYYYGSELQTVVNEPIYNGNSYFIFIFSIKSKPRIMVTLDSVHQNACPGEFNIHVFQVCCALFSWIKMFIDHETNQSNSLQCSPYKIQTSSMERDSILCIYLSTLIVHFHYSSILSLLRHVFDCIERSWPIN